ncbi:SAM domain (Sterile alpha motif) [Microdochium nivale]|nr:SAM domain (Sterile alpha motif) [Microdochium nivale]
MYTQYRPSEQSQMEMRQKSRLHDPFFGLKTIDLRPESVATEIMDTDWDDDIISDNEDELANSPRVSLNSSGQPSFTTLSSYEEAHTPRSSRARQAYHFDMDPSVTIQGPRGPHLFRSSTSSSQNFDFPETLTLSPITPKAPNQGMYPLMAQHIQPARESIYQFTLENLDAHDLSLWSPEQVAQWMLDAGVEFADALKFVENDINGAILITLKFEDLRELQIHSFGVRTKIWEEIHKLRNDKPPSPRPDTPIEDEEDKEAKRERKQQLRAAEFAELERSASVNRQKSMKKKRPSQEDIISPLESVSIVGIEQMMPKLHSCSKGENCSKWRRNQRLIEAFKKDHPFVDMEKGGVIMMAGNPGNPQTADAINRPSSMEPFRPFSDAVPSVVASSDVMGLGGLPPLQYLQEATLRNLQTRDPQDNVMHFLDFQHQHDECDSSEVPPTPPFELQPSTQPHTGLRALPKLSIPGQSRQSPQSSPDSQRSQVSQSISEPTRSFTPYQMERVDARDPALQTPVAPYRFGTPFSDMDVPVTSVNLGPVARDASQSVPPDMNYRAGPSAVISRSLSRASRRPSFRVMEPLAEHVTISNGIAPPRSPPRFARATPPAQAPPRTVYPWSPVTEKAPSFQSALPAKIANKANEILTGGLVKDDEGISYQGPVRKRKTKMLRHEWHAQYATLKGTRLALHRDRESRERTLEYVDIDDYAIACSSMSTTSKLNAAFKAMSISRGGDKRRSAEDPVGAFSFQLIPSEGRTLGRLRKRESASFSGPITGLTGASSEGVNGTGKTHHFAVSGRDERIDWMRELMLAKALKQKGAGFEVSVNGNMI